MSIYVNMKFRIRTKQFTRELVSKVVAALHSAHGFSMSKEEREELVDEVYKQGKGGWVEVFGRKTDFKPYDCLLSATVVERDAKGVIRRSGLVSEGFVQVGLSVPYRVWFPRHSYWRYFRYVGRKLRKVFVRDAVLLYDVLHPFWGIIAYDTNFDRPLEDDPQAFLFSDAFVKYLFATNFYPPEWAKKIDVNALKKLGVYRVERLKDGGLMMQLNKEPTGGRESDLIADDVAKITGQKVTHEAERERRESVSKPISRKVTAKDRERARRFLERLRKTRENSDIK